MKNRVYPTWDEIKKFHNPLTEGEEKLAHFLDDKLPEEWEIFVQPYLNGNRPDIVVSNPKVGVMIYEVKDWDLGSYHFENGQLLVSTAEDSYPVENPEKKVDYYKKKVIEQLVPILGEEADRNERAYGLVKTGLYFHKMSGKDAREFFNKPRRPVIIGSDDLYDSNNLRNIVPDSGIPPKGKYMKEEWAKEIRWWLKPPFHSLEQTQDFELTPEQKGHAEPQSGHFRLRGVTGSGKTLIVAYRAAKLASQGFKVLVITFNITLWHWIKDMVARAPFNFEWSRIIFRHFHGFCKDILNELDAPTPPYEDYFEKIIPAIQNALEMATQRGENVENLKFDAILIDEGQDYAWEWYNCLCQFLRERDELLLVCDKKQNIYRRDLNWIDGKMRNVKFRGTWRELKRIYRLPKKIGNAANDFGNTFKLDQSVEVEEYKQLKLFERVPQAHLVWKNIQSDEYLDHIKNAYNQIKSAQEEDDEGHPSDVVILLPTNDIGMKAVTYFEGQDIKVNYVFEDEMEGRYHRHKKSFWLGDSRLKMSTVHSFKGWEAVHVILLIPEKWKDSENLDALVYTAMTRTRENLIVLNCNGRYVEYGRNLPSKWDTQ